MGPTHELPTLSAQILQDVLIGAGAPWYSAQRNVANEAGIVGICKDIQLRETGMFHPNAELRRSEGACIMVNTLRVHRQQG